jgi:hypothetical protein
LLHAWAYFLDPGEGDVLDAFFALDHKGEGPEGVTLAVGTVAGGLAAATVSQGERAREGVGRDLETSQQLTFAAAQGVGGRA